MLSQEIFSILFDLTRDYDLEEISIRTPEGKFKVCRKSAPTENQPSFLPETSSRGHAKMGTKLELEQGDVVKVVSPLMGVFYRASAPGHPPFVEVGDKVDAGATLCIIEAMKVMNEIVAEITGTVVQIIPQNGDVVEENSILFFLKPG